MQGRYYFPRLAAMMLLSLSLFTACRQEDKAVQPAAAQAAKLAFLVENLDNAKASDADLKKAGEWMNGLTFEEMESLIDLRHQHYLKRSDADRERAAYLLDLRHKLNRTAYERKGKPFHQLDFAHSEEIIQMVTPRKSKKQYAAGARTSGDCVLTSNPPCAAWMGNGSVAVEANVSGDKEITGIYLGLATLQCGPNSYQDDCDYVFRYQFSKLYAPAYWEHFPPIMLIVGNPAAIKLMDNNPARVDCGSYTMQLLFGKTRIDFNYWTPQDAASMTKLVLNRSIESGWCYTGTWGTEKWYSGGIYYPVYDRWGANNVNTGWPVCACTVENYVVY